MSDIFWGSFCGGFVGVSVSMMFMTAYIGGKMQNAVTEIKYRFVGKKEDVEQFMRDQGMEDVEIERVKKDL